ncbi:hypothetical protein HMPREF9469_06027 [ [[Clostridium] citroniae WAL-17108]|uniref:Uncharacterized protein n=1 Tax=[Clostridium] citroniae WAL-17108 TaxID=742733 RepID=G5HTW5_9FIRM|nr:hypothetical protein HMPREF9469_06027 [ [[Clostridium] citroniae WAL-17108]
MKNNKHMLENLSKITKETDCIFIENIIIIIFYAT